MANPIGEAFITLRPDVSKFSNEAGQALSSSLGQLGSKFSTVGRAFTVGVSLPIVAGFALAGKAAIDFQNDVTGIEQKVSGTPAQIQAIVDGARAMSKELPFSSHAILDMAKTAGQMGVAADDILGFSRVVLEFARNTKMSAEDAGTAIAKFINIMGDSPDKVENLASTIEYLGNVGASTEAQILDMALRIAGAGKVAGLSSPEVLGFANALLSVGLDAEAGGTAISRAFLEMNSAVAEFNAAPTEDQLLAITSAQRALRDSSDGLVTAQRGVRDANEQVEGSYRGVAEANRNIERANQTLGDAYRDLAKAQRDQTQASFDARRETLSVAQAQQHYNEVVAKAPSLALDYKQAQLDVVSAQRRVNEAIAAGPKEIGEAQRRLDELRRSGTASASSLASAERSLNEARAKDRTLDIALANQGLARSQQRLNELAVSQKGYALEVASANLTVLETVNKQGTAAETQAEKIVRARRQIVDAQRGVDDANYGGVQADRALRNSQEGLIDARKNVVRAGESVADNQRKLNDLTDKSRGAIGTFAKVAGMSVEEFAKLYKDDAAGAMNAFLGGIRQMSKEGTDLAPILDKLGLGELRTADALRRLALGEVDIPKMLAAANEAYVKNIEHQRQNAAAADDTSAKIQIFKNHVNDLAVTIGTALLPMLEGFIATIEPVFPILDSIAQAFADMPAPVQAIIVGLALLAAAIGPLLLVLGMMLTSWAALVFVAPGVAAGITAVAASIGAFMLAAAPFLLVLAAIALAAYLIYKNWDTIGPAITKAANAIKDAIIGAFNAVLDFFKGNWKTIAVLISGPFAPLVALALDAFGVRSALVDAFNAVLKFVRENWKEIASLISGPFVGLVALALDAFGVRSALTKAFSTAGTWLLNAGKNVVTGFLNGITSMIPNLDKLLKSITDRIPRLKGPPEVDRAILEPSGEMVMAGFSKGLDTGWQDVSRQLAGYAPQIAGAGFGKAGLAATTSGGGGGGGAASSEIAMKSAGLAVNLYGPVYTRGDGAQAGLRTLGWGLAAEAQRRGIYTS